MRIVVSTSCTSSAEKRMLVYTKNGEGYVHKNIPNSVAMLKELGKENGILVDVSDDPNQFTDENLAKYNVLVFSNTNNEAFDNESQRKAFQKFIQNGGGFVGIHSSCASERDWPWYWALVGAKFVRHPKLQPFDIKIIDHNHPSTSFLPDVWKWEDECYYLDHFFPDINVLLAADLTRVEDEKKAEYPGDAFGDLLPLAWYHEFDGGRQWYTALGHKPEHYQDENFKKHILGGILWTMGAGK